MLDWSKLPDVGAVALLASAFSAVTRRSQTHVSGLWLAGWVMIALHFVAFTFLPLNGTAGLLAAFIGLSALVWAGLTFLRATLPYPQEPSSLWMSAVLLATNTLYIGLITFTPNAAGPLTLAAVLFGVGPLAVALLALRRFTHPLRWITVALYAALSVFLLLFQLRAGNGSTLALNAVLFTVYFDCSLHFWSTSRRYTTGAFITSAAFLAWSLVFVVSPCIGTVLPAVSIESEVWNLPKYVVAVGMILLVLEDQIEHNKHLALHDELTGLPNRRLFLDRLGSALERARRTGSHTALLLIDLDYFKQVNDTVGHHVGDQVLRRAGAIFQRRVRRTDTVARTGGDEFSVILEAPTSRDDAERVGQSLMQLLGAPIEVEGHSLRIGASVGIAVYPDDAPNAEALRIAADLRMYADKYASRSQPADAAGSFNNNPASVAEAQSGA